MLRAEIAVPHPPTYRVAAGVAAVVVQEPTEINAYFSDSYISLEDIPPNDNAPEAIPTPAPLFLI